MIGEKTLIVPKKMNKFSTKLNVIN